MKEKKIATVIDCSFYVKIHELATFNQFVFTRFLVCLLYRENGRLVNKILNNIHQLNPVEIIMFLIHFFSVCTNKMHLPI